MDRIKWITLDPPEDGYEAYLYHLKIWKALSDKQSKNYIGWHKGRFETDPYVFSSKDKELAADYATGAKVEYHVIQYGTCYNMAYMETVMLNQAEGGIGAAKSPNWYNKTNGGGKYSVGYTGEMRVNDIMSRLAMTWHKKSNTFLDNPAYTIGKSSKTDIANMLSQDQLFQCRWNVYDAEYVTQYMDGFDENPDPDNWPPLILLMPKKGSKNLPYIVGGNQSGRGCVKSKHGYEMNHIEVPYSDWGPLVVREKVSDVIRLGNRLNPRHKKQSKQQDEKDAARWVMFHCKQHSLTKKDKDMKDVYDVHHSSVHEELQKNGWKKRQITAICTRAQTMIENALDHGDNVIGWDDQSLKVDDSSKKDDSTPEDNGDPLRLQNFLLRKDAHLKENGGEFDWVYKTSVDVGYHKVLEEVERSGYKKKGLVMFYFKNTEHQNQYLTNNVPGSPNQHGVEFGATRWAKWQTKFLSGFDITTQYLPVTRKQARVDGWYDEIEEDEGDSEE